MISYRSTKDSPFHISAGGVVFNDAGEVLLLSRVVEPDGSPGLFHLPKGTVELGEPIEATAVREIQEESGWSVELVAYIGGLHSEFESYGIAIDKSVHYFACKASSQENEIDSEHDNVGWYKYEDAFAKLSVGPKSENVILARAKQYVH